MSRIDRIPPPNLDPQVNPPPAPKLEPDYPEEAVKLRISPQAIREVNPTHDDLPVANLSELKTRVSEVRASIAADPQAAMRTQANSYPHPVLAVLAN